MSWPHAKAAAYDVAVWGLTTHWADLALFTFLLLIGHIALGHFEDYKPVWRRLMKAMLGVTLFTAILLFAGRFWAWTLFVLPTFLAVIWIHAIWLPRKGVNGWTGEPRDRYLELVGVKSREEG